MARGRATKTDKTRAIRVPDLFATAARRDGIFCGIDEAGRGPLAGPVVAAAVILLPGAQGLPLNDSKKLDEAQRESLFEALKPCAIIGVGQASVEEIDRINILQATFLAMQRAFSNLAQVPALALIDGNRAPRLPCPVETIIGGDGIEPAIAAASIVAKVTRDRLMVALDAEYPRYGFARHKGYGTSAHLESLVVHGPCAHHRLSFAPLKRSVDESD